VDDLGIADYLRHAWNAFTNQNRRVETPYVYSDYYGLHSSSRPDRRRLTFSNERSIISSIFTRLSIDVSTIDIRHVRTDDQRRYLEDIESGLNNCLTLEANIDQAARQFRIDIMMSLCDRGVIALVPVDTSISPEKSGGFDILTLRVGDIVAWYPHHVRVSLYNEATGVREELTLEKKFVAVIENPLYTVMNEPNSTLQRLIRKLNLLDGSDEVVASGKLDLIIQLPYVIKSEARRQQAEQRRADIEFQLKGSQYGIAYTDGTEKITQLNRPAENNLLVQIEYLTKLLYSQLGLTEEVMNGTADEKAMLNYYNRTIEPFLTAIVEAMRRSFLTKTARSQRQTIMFFRDPFRLVPIDNIAEIADKFTRNEILTSNEMRQAIGMAPHSDPKADQLVNSNMPQADTGVPSTRIESDPVVDKVLAKIGANGNGDVQNG
jgi:Phage portal protein